MSHTIIYVAVVIVVLAGVLLWINMRIFRGQLQPQTAVQANTTHRTNHEIVNGQHEDVPELPLLQLQPESDISMEVLHQKPSSRPSVFERPTYPFTLHETSVPAFADESWIRVFRNLTNDEQVLGWVAFQNDVIGAADRLYDVSFTDVLRTYWHTVEKLRKEIGVSQIRETSIVGAEGQVWFINAVDDVWLALFVEGITDVSKLTENILANLRVLQA